MSNPFVKGAVSGVGVVSVLAALGEILALITRSSDDATSLRGHGA